MVDIAELVGYRPEYLGAKGDGDPTTLTGTDCAPAFNAMLAKCAGQHKIIVPKGFFVAYSPIFYGGVKDIHIEFEAGAVLMAAATWGLPFVSLISLKAYGTTELSYNGRGGNPADRQIIHISGPGRIDARRLVPQGTGQGSVAMSLNGMSMTDVVVRDLEFIGTDFDVNGEPGEWSGSPYNDTGLGIMGGSNIVVENVRCYGFQDAGMYLGGDFDGKGQNLKVLNNHTDRCNFGITVKRNFKRLNVIGNSNERGTVGISLLYATASGAPVNQQAAQAQAVIGNSSYQVSTPFWFESQKGLVATGNKASEMGITDNIHNATAASMFKLDGCQGCRISDNVLDGVQTLYPARMPNNSTAFNFAKLNTFGPVTIDGVSTTTHSTDNVIENNTVTGVYAGVVEADANQNNNIVRNMKITGATVKYDLKGAGSIAVENNRPNVLKAARTYPTFRGTAIASVAIPAVDKVYFYPFVLESDIAVAQLVARVNAAGAGSSVKLGLWANSKTSSKPVGAPLAAFNTGIDTSTTGTKLADIADTALRAGLYWIGTKATGTLPSLYSIPQYNQQTAELIGESLITTGYSYDDAYANDMPTIAEGATFTQVSSGGIPVVSLIT